MRDLPPDSPIRRIAADAAAEMDGMLAAFVPGRSRAIEPQECDFYEWYFAYGKVLRPRSILEIGVLGGGSAVAMCLGAGAVERVLLIDNESHDQPVPLADAATAVRRAAPAASVVSWREDSQRIARLTDETHGALFDLISIDGDHRVGPCYHDLRICLPCLAPDGHILVDDAQWCWVKEAADAFVGAHPELDDLFVQTKTGTRILHQAGEHLTRCPLLHPSPNQGAA